MASLFNSDRIECNTRYFSEDASELRFLLGGIGTGNISIGSRGQLTDFEIFNSANKGLKLPYTFFTIWTKRQGQKSVSKVLESEYLGPQYKSNGFPSGDMMGLPRFKHSRFSSHYPFANIELQHPNFGFDINIEAFTPFIPLNADDSGIPGFIIRYNVKNISTLPSDVSIAGSMINVCGFQSYDGLDNLQLKTSVKNQAVDTGKLTGIYFTSDELSPCDIDFGTLSLTTSNRENITLMPEWQHGGWWDGAQNFWNDFSDDGEIGCQDTQFGLASNITAETQNQRVGSVAAKYHIDPGEEKTFEFLISWHFPNRYKGWFKPQYCCGDKCDIETVKNYYATKFCNALDAAEYLEAHKNNLEKHSRDFANALYSTTMPPAVIDALASNITVIRSSTCFRIETGQFLAFEGCKDGSGCCDGNCTHVWNYAQTLAFLFPKLERTMREMEFLTETEENGAMNFRAHKVFDMPAFQMIPAVDGQLGCIIRLYRDWKLCGDDVYLSSLWVKVASTLNFAFGYWDTDNDGVLDSAQHNTYDIEFYGINSMTNTIFLAALKAGAEMAEHIGDLENSKKWYTALRNGSQKLDRLLWNGEYYVQVIDDVNTHQYQYGTGCLSDQIFGQQLAHVAGLGYVLPKDHVLSAIKSIYKYNFKRSFDDIESVQRIYVAADESGLVLCTWPRGNRPKQPFVYSDEIWTGIEYQVATHLIFEGEIKSGINIVSAVRKRQDGYRRSPFNEIECGHHYSRSLASWGLLIALSGYKFDLVNHNISFDPKIETQNFQCFFSTAFGWGVYKQIETVSGLKHSITPLYGTLENIILQ